MNSKILFNDVPYVVYSSHEEKETLTLSRVGLSPQPVGTIVVVEHDDGSVFTGRVGRKNGKNAYGHTIGRTALSQYKNPVARNVIDIQCKKGTK